MIRTLGTALIPPHRRVSTSHCDYAIPGEVKTGLGPFGGAKHSGYGLEFGVEGLKSVPVPQVISG
jgi:hypothetical protein